MKILAEDLRAFAKERQWEKFHSPKNLAMALSVEASEIVELFQWMTEEESRTLSDEKLKMLKEEIGDVMIYLLNLSDKFAIDPIESAKEKFEINKKKYPVHKVKGRADKYTEYKD